jgi:hypothetical protein
MRVISGEVIRNADGSVATCTGCGGTLTSYESVAKLDGKGTECHIADEEAGVMVIREDQPDGRDMRCVTGKVELEINCVQCKHK